MLSVLIVNWNTRDRLRSCLLSIRRFPPSEPFEVVVVDNASSDGSAEMVRTEFPDFLLVENASNVGYARGNNDAFARCFAGSASNSRAWMARAHCDDVTT